MHLQFLPKMLWKRVLKDHHYYHIMQCPVIVFHNSIFLSQSRLREVVRIAFLIIELFKQIILEFSSMVISHR